MVLGKQCQSLAQDIHTSAFPARSLQCLGVFQSNSVVLHCAAKQFDVICIHPFEFNSQMSRCTFVKEAVVDRIFNNGLEHHGGNAVVFQIKHLGSFQGELKAHVKSQLLNLDVVLNELQFIFQGDGMVGSRFQQGLLQAGECFQIGFGLGGVFFLQEGLNG